MNFSQLDLSISLRAAPDSAASCLREEAQLRRWFAERVELEPFLGGRFLFEGPTVLFGEVAAKITEWDPRHIAFVRTLLGADTTVHWVVSEHPEGACVSWRQTLPDNREEYGYFVANDQAAVALYNLRSYVETGAIAIRLVPPESGTVRLHVTIQAPSGDVWAALTVPEEMDRFLSQEAEVDLREGGRYSYGWKDGGPSQILELEPGRELRHDWNYLGEPETQVRWTVEGTGGETVVTLTHSGFGDYDNVPPYVTGWAAFLLAMKAQVEGREKLA